MLQPVHKPEHSPKRICMITHSFYASDCRVRRYAEALAERGDSVEVIALRPRSNVAKEEIIKAVKLYRIQDRFGKNETTELSFLWPVLRFLFLSSRLLNRLQRHKPFDLIHIHNMPDFLVFAAWRAKLCGAKVILDIHDLMPELFSSKFGKSQSSTLASGLKLAERVSAAMADHIIVANHLWLEKYRARSAPAGKCSVFINYVDETIFFPRPRKPHDGKAIVMFPGGLQWHQGVDIAIRAFQKLHPQVPHAELHIYGDGHMKPQLVRLTQELGLTGVVRFFNCVRLEEIARLMAEADVGIVPKRADGFGNEAYSTKILEFMSLAVPMVVASTKVDRYYFNDSIVRFFESGNPDDLARAIIEVLGNHELRANMTKRASQYVSQNGWNSCKRNYLDLVDSLCAVSAASVSNTVETTHAS